jgi:Ca-activated chloride channel family protein
VAFVTFLPLAPVPVLLVLLVAALSAIWWSPRQHAVPGESSSTHWRLTAAAGLLFIAVLRPGMSGPLEQSRATNLSVYFVVDTTTSIVAEDYGPGRPRLDGVRSEILAIGAALPDARYSVLTFDTDTRVRLPLTTDTVALEAAVETLAPQPSEFSRGSSVTQAKDRLQSLLARSAASHPERGRIVFYLGDGEQTATDAPEPFSLSSGLVQGGGVLGYGTDEGGPMAATLSRYGADLGHVKDPRTGEDAISAIDESRLRSIAVQLGVAYSHRFAGDPVDPVVAGIDLARLGHDEHDQQARLQGRHELYWPLLLGVAFIGAWELGGAVTAVRAARTRRSPA